MIPVTLHYILNAIANANSLCLDRLYGIDLELSGIIIVLLRRVSGSISVSSTSIESRSSLLSSEKSACIRGLSSSLGGRISLSILDIKSAASRVLSWPLLIVSKTLISGLSLGVFLIAFRRLFETDIVLVFPLLVTLLRSRIDLSLTVNNSCALY